MFKIKQHAHALGLLGNRNLIYCAVEKSRHTATTTSLLRAHAKLIPFSVIAMAATATVVVFTLFLSIANCAYSAPDENVYKILDLNKQLKLKDEEINNLKERFEKKIETELENRKSELVKCDDVVKEKISEINKEKQNLVKCESKLEAKGDEILDLKLQVSHLETKLSDLKVLLSDYANRENTTKKINKQKNASINKLHELLNKEKNNLSICSSSLRHHEEKLSDCRNLLHSCQANHTIAGSKHGVCKEKLIDCRNLLDLCQTNRTIAVRRLNGYGNLLDLCQTNLTIAANKHALCLNDLDTLRKNHTIEKASLSYVTRFLYNKLNNTNNFIQQHLNETVNNK